MGRSKVVICMLVAAAGLTAAIPAGSTASSAPNVSWTELLPPLPTNRDAQPGPVPGCRAPALECMDRLIERMRRLKVKFGCDHRGVFATTYMELSKVLRRSLKHNQGRWRFPRYLYTEAAYFAHFYFRTLKRWQRGEAVPPAWRIALETWRDKSVLGAQDMLLGINAHVQSDMPFVIAALGVRTRKGESRKTDHDRVNQTLNDAYDRVVSAVRSRFDPSLGMTNPDITFGDDLAGLEMVRLWREGVWRNAERLQNAQSPAEREAIGQSIMDYAAGWASGIAMIESPGYRAERDAYCEERLASRAR